MVDLDHAGRRLRDVSFAEPPPIDAIRRAASTRRRRKRYAAGVAAVTFAAAVAVPAAIFTHGSHHRGEPVAVGPGRQPDASARRTAGPVDVPAGWHRIVYDRLGLVVPRSWRVGYTVCLVRTPMVYIDANNGDCPVGAEHDDLDGSVFVSTNPRPALPTWKSGQINGVSVRTAGDSVYVPSIRMLLDPVGKVGVRVVRTLSVVPPDSHWGTVTGAVRVELGGPSGKIESPTNAATVTLVARGGTGPRYLALTGQRGRFILRVPPGKYVASSDACRIVPSVTDVTVRPAASSRATLVCANDNG